MNFVRRHTKDYNFIGNIENGMTIRWGKTFDDNPIKAPLPELVDISISNHCSKGCSYCYRNSSQNNSFISLFDYELILKSLFDPKLGNVFQVALGGGEPLEHPDFLEILKITRKYNVIPNFTTNALYITKQIAYQIKPLIGAVAISLPNINEVSFTNAHIYIEEGIKTNIHFILDRLSIKQGIEILEGTYNELLIGYNAIIFLTFKPMGRGTEDMCLILNDELIRFCKLIDKNSCILNIGFDSCFMPMLMHYTNTSLDFIEPCECAFFSAYIDENLNVKPCSFSTHNKDTYNLKEIPFSEIWNKYWNTYRNSQINTCKRDCKNLSNCRGGCPYFNKINLCKTDKQAKSLA